VLTYQSGEALTDVTAPSNDSTAGHYYKEGREYDGAGNEMLMGVAERHDINSDLAFAQRVSFYDAGNRLRVTERHLGGFSQGNLNTATDFGAYEEYRYDALGRRVFVVSLSGGEGSYMTDEHFRYDALGRRVWALMNHGANCSKQKPWGGCFNTLLRSAWDRDRLIYEIQTAADSGASLENDSPSENCFAIPHLRYHGGGRGRRTFLLSTAIEIRKLESRPRSPHRCDIYQ